MKIVKNINDISSTPKAITIGNFDGVHKGHQELLNQTRKIARENNLESLIFTFDKFPREIFNPKDFHRLYNNENKESFFKSYEIDTLLSIDFNEIMNVNAERFCEDILIDQLNLKFLVIGDNFRFGKNRSGDINLLKNYQDDRSFELIIPDSVLYKNESISSSRIRNFLQEGDLNAANECLGKEYMISGTVVSGEKLGRKLGYPTANISLDHDYPLDGVYLTKTILDKKNYLSLTSIGDKPTFNGTEKLLEVFILDFDKDIYGEKLEICFLEEIRKQIKFNNQDELIKQMNEDYKYAIIRSKKYGI
jgi:riboflavin kinase/FMN adenylyltransferase